MLTLYKAEYGTKLLQIPTNCTLKTYTKKENSHELAGSLYTEGLNVNNILHFLVSYILLPWSYLDYLVVMVLGEGRGGESRNEG